MIMTETLPDNSLPVDDEGEPISTVAASADALSLKLFSDNLSSITTTRSQPFDPLIALQDVPSYNELEYNSTDRFQPCSFFHASFEPISSYSPTAHIQPSLYISADNVTNAYDNTICPIHDKNNQNSRPWTGNTCQVIEGSNAALDLKRTPTNKILSGVQTTVLDYSNVVHESMSQRVQSILISTNLSSADKTFGLAEGYATTSSPSVPQAQSLPTAALYKGSTPRHEHTAKLMDHYGTTHAAVYTDTTQAYGGSASDFDDGTPSQVLATAHISTRYQLEAWMHETSDEDMTWTEKNKSA
ncbi:hypothetical protein BDZ45DRAFT_351454 [Acephala macrosclerotiorum]|nr:hypothetical protein BDZ45DRAFT_351454 [Acephala macrosclerotiorum]